MQQNHTNATHFSSANIHVCRAHVDTSVIRVRGGLSKPATASVWRAVKAELRRSPDMVALDLSEVSDVDDAGIGVLVSTAICAGESDISLCLVGACEGAVGAALAKADLTELFEIVPADAAH